MANVSVFYQHVKRNQLQCQTGLIDIFRSKLDHISERRIDLNYQKTHNNKKTYTVMEIAEILGIGRTSAYNLVKENHFKVVK